MLNQESETCEEKLQRMVKSIAEDISNGNEIGGAYA